ncbi:MAG TPA: hypothetical protein PK821_08710 [Victivallales bacterium]|nr:hypothetical protein [Victivallales bacterium]
MKEKNFSRIVLLMMVSCILALTQISAGAQTQRRISSVIVKAEFAQTADIKSPNVPSLGSPGKWIQINIDFATALINSPLGKNYFEWLDNVRVETEIILPTGHPQKQYALLMGKADYWSFALDGKEHHLVMFVPPDILKRWAPSQKFSSSDIKKLEIKVSFKQNDALIALGFQTPKERTELEVARRFESVGLNTSIDRVRNAVYSVDRTPWAPLNFDYYELLKTSKSEE